MAFHVIIARLNGSPSDAAVLDGALALATVSKGHVRALFCRPDPRIVAASVNEGLHAGFYGDLISTLEREWTASASRALAEFNAWKARNNMCEPRAADQRKGPSAEWFEIMGNEAEIMCRQGRVSDIVITPLPSHNVADPYDAGFEAALLDTGRPILLAPLHQRLVVRGINALIAWNGSAEAARAVAAALPLLHRVKHVSVFTAAEGRVERGMADELIGYLARHGIAAVVLDDSYDDNSVEEDLRAAMRKSDAGLLVMGAYTHSRWRELIFGGVTRHMFDHANIPILMAH